MIISFLQRNVSVLTEKSPSAQEAFNRSAALSDTNRFRAASSAISAFGHLMKAATTNPPSWIWLVVCLRLSEGAKKLGMECRALLQKIKIIALATLMIALGLLFPQTVFKPLAVTKSEKKPEPHFYEEVNKQALVPLHTPSHDWVQAEFIIGKEKSTILFDLSNQELLASLRRFNPQITQTLLDLVASSHTELYKRISIHLENSNAFPFLSLSTEDPALPPEPVAKLHGSEKSMTPRRFLPSIPRTLSIKYPPKEVALPPQEKPVEIDFEVLPQLTEIERFHQNYVERYCRGYQLEDVKALIEKGRTLIRLIQSEEAEFIEKNERRHWMAPFVWALMFHSFKKGVSYQQGMSRFADPDHKIARFFSQAATARYSTHFSEERLDAFGMDIEQNHCTGLPANHQTVLFGRLKQRHGIEESYLKPENWGTESLYQMTGHAVDYVYTRFQKPGPNDRKEHLPTHILSEFQSIYQKLTQENSFPPDIRLYGISEMARFFMKYLEVNPQDENLKCIAPFLEKLEKLNPSLSQLTVKAKETWAGTSFLNDEPSTPSRETLAYRQFKALFQLKTAKDDREIIEALHLLKGFEQDWAAYPYLEDNLRPYLKEGEIQKLALLHQVQRDLTSAKGPEMFYVDSIPYQGEPGKTAEDLLNYLLSTPSIQGNERKALTALSLMQQGVKQSIYFKIYHTMKSPISGLDIAGYTNGNERIAEVKITTTPALKIEIWQKYCIKSVDLALPTYREKPYAILMSHIEIDYSTPSPTGRLKWNIEQVCDIHK